MASNLIFIVAEARRKGTITPYLTAVRREIVSMASRIVPSEIRDDATSEAMLSFMELIWPRMDMERSDRQIALCLSIALAGKLKDCVRYNRRAYQPAEEPAEDSLEPAGPMTISDPLAREMFREILDVLDGRERKMAELLAGGHSITSASRSLKISPRHGHRLVLRIRQQLRFCLA